MRANIRSLEMTVQPNKKKQYLEEQRSHFARLYFIGDEDLLEILGHSKDPVKVSKHLKKMFPGIAGFVLNESGNASCVLLLLFFLLHVL